MTKISPRRWQFLGGIAFGVAAGATAMMMLLDRPAPAARPATATLGAAAAPAPAAAAEAIAESECGRAPLLAKSGDDDGQARLQSRPAGASAEEVASLILKGKEAAASQRQRDAEILFLNACRSAEGLKASQPVALADAMYQLARHYANAAAFGAQPSRQLYERAEHLYSASVLAYTARHGASHEKTRFAQEGLTTVQQVTGRRGPVVVAKAEPPKPVPAPKAAEPATAPAAAQAPAPAPAQTRPQAEPQPQARAQSQVPREPQAQAPVAAPTRTPAAPSAPPAAAVVPPTAEQARARPAQRAPEQAPPQQRSESTAAVSPPAAPAPPPQARRTNPSFDCARARSTTEQLICADEDLARQDRELGRLHQRARQAAADPRAFQRESDVKWQQREATCRDRECLQRWYAQRRAELGSAATRRSPSAPDADAAAPRRGQEPSSTAVSGAGPAAPEMPRRVRQAERPRPLEMPAAAPREEAQPSVDLPASPGTASGSAGVAPAAEGSAVGQ